MNCHDCWAAGRRLQFNDGPVIYSLRTGFSHARSAVSDPPPPRTLRPDRGLRRPFGRLVRTPADIAAPCLAELRLEPPRSPPAVPLSVSGPQHTRAPIHATPPRPFTMSNSGGFSPQYARGRARYLWRNACRGTEAVAEPPLRNSCSHGALAAFGIWPKPLLRIGQCLARAPARY